MQLRRSLRLLVDYPERGLARPDLYSGCRSPTIEAHVAFYTVTEDAIVVDRVLHHNRDAGEEVAR